MLVTSFVIFIISKADYCQLHFLAIFFRFFNDSFSYCSRFALGSDSEVLQDGLV